MSFIYIYLSSNMIYRYEDVHQRLEERLQMMPRMVDGHHSLMHFTFGACPRPRR